MNPPLPESQRFWRHAVSHVMRRVNAAAWAERFMPGAFAGATVAALAFYALRRLRGPAEWGWPVLAAGLAIAAFAAWRLARRGFFSRDDARAFLEYQMRLDSRLSAAESGAAAWPAGAATGRVLRWKKTNLAGWAVAALAMLAAGLWLPVPELQGLQVAPVEKPPALAQTEEWLKNLEQTGVADERSLENLKAQARELASKPTENQYSHSSLEAADTLRAQAAQAMQNLAQHFEQAESALSALEAGKAGAGAGTEGAMSDEQVKRAGEQLENALRGMREGTLAANAELAGSLGDVNLQNLRELTAEEAAKLAKQMGGAGKQIRAIAKGVALDGDPESGAGKLFALADALENNAAKSVRVRGGGGVGRGRDDAPLTFAQRPSHAGGGNMQTVKNDDYARAALGDKLGTQTGEHTVDPGAAAGPAAAGALSGQARGGDAVWVNKLTPAEREALAEFYK